MYHRPTRFLPLLLALLLFLLPSLSAFAATYYVQAGSGGSTCTQSAPCGTIATGLSKMSGGDTLLIRGGTYVEVLSGYQLANGTSEGTRTLIAGYPGETAILLPSPGQAGNVVDIFAWVPGDERKYITFDNLVFDATNLTNGLTISGPYTHHIRVQNSTVANANNQGISGYGTGGNNPHDMEFINLDVYNHGKAAGRLDHGFYYCGVNTIIRDSRVHNNSGYGLQIYDTGSANCADGNKIYNNQVYSNRGDGNVTLQHGVNIQFYNNVVYDKDNSVDIASGTPNNTQIYNNTMDGVIRVYGGSNAIIRNNIASAVDLHPPLGNPGPGNVEDHNLTYTSGRFVRAESREYHLARESVARETGVAVTLVTDDGAPLPQLQGVPPH